MEQILNEVRAERQRQDEKWGEQNYKPIEFIGILTEEVGEAAREANDFFLGKGEADPTLNAGPNLQRERLMKYRKECIEVAAVAVQMVESLDRNIDNLLFYGTK